MQKDCRSDPCPAVVRAFALARLVSSGISAPSLRAFMNNAGFGVGVQNISALRVSSGTAVRVVSRLGGPAGYLTINRRYVRWRTVRSERVVHYSVRCSFLVSLLPIKRTFVTIHPERLPQILPGFLCRPPRSALLSLTARGLPRRPMPGVNGWREGDLFTTRPKRTGTGRHNDVPAGYNGAKLREADLSKPRNARLSPPVGNLPVDLGPGRAATLLDPACELVAPPCDDVEVVSGQFSPLHPGLAGDPFPVAL